MFEESNIHWLVRKHEHNDWIKETPTLIAIFSSLAKAKQKQKILLDEWAKNVCADEDDIVIDYDNGIVTFKSDNDAYFKVDIEEFKNK